MDSLSLTRRVNWEELYIVDLIPPIFPSPNYSAIKITFFIAPLDNSRRFAKREFNGF